MIVEVKVPIVSSVFEFDLNEDEIIGDLQIEITETICQKLKIKNTSDFSLILLHQQTKSILNNYQTLVQAEVKRGDTLIIV